MDFIALYKKKAPGPKFKSNKNTNVLSTETYCLAEIGYQPKCHLQIAETGALLSFCHANAFLHFVVCSAALCSQRMSKKSPETTFFFLVYCMTVAIATCVHVNCRHCNCCLKAPSHIPLGHLDLISIRENGEAI